MNPLPTHVNGETIASFLSRVPKQKDPEKQALFDSLLEALKATPPKICYYCTKKNFQSRAQYERHVLLNHNQKIAYPNLPYLEGYELEASRLSLGGMIMLNLEEFLDEIKPSIKWNASTGYHRCTGCGRQMDSTEKLTHWPKHCSLSKDKTVQKLRAEVLSENFPEEEKPAVKEAGLDWYQNQIKINESLPIDFKPTGAPINEDLYPSTI